MALSVIDPVGLAIERAKRVCFQPFDLGKWFTIGFCAFLAGFVEGGGSSVPTNFNFNTGFRGSGPGGGGGGQTPGEQMRMAIHWIQAHLTPIVLIGASLLIAFFLLGVVLSWLGSRGQFMFIENIARNRGAVVAPWREYRKEGNSVFWFHFLFGFASFAAFVVVFLGAILIALPDIKARHFGPAAGIALAVGISTFALLAIVTGVINLFLNDFVVPIMYVRRIGVMAAWGEFRTSMLAGNVGTFVLYILFKVLIAIPVGFLVLFVTCCTCFIAIIPYLGSVITLPLFVFGRSYSLCFIEQFGPEWRIFATVDARDEEFVDVDDWEDERFRPGDEHIRPADDFDRPPDDRFRPE